MPTAADKTPTQSIAQPAVPAPFPPEVWPGSDADAVAAMRALVERHLVSTLARHTGSATPRDWWVATVLSVRDTIHERMIATQAVHNAQNVRRVYYFSLE